MRFNGDAYSKLFPKHDEPETKVESVVEDNVCSDDNVIEDEHNDLVD